MPAIPDKCQLLHGPYTPPNLRRGDRATCHLRGMVKITSWTDAPIPCPRCKIVGQRGGSGVLLDDELARAVRQESAAAVCCWWGVHEGVVWRWRKVLGVDRMNNPETHRLVKAAAQAGADAIKAKEWTAAELKVKSRLAKERNSAQHLPPGYHGKWWTDEENKLLGKVPDEEVAARIGRTREAVRCQRQKLGIDNPASTVWTDEELALLGTMPDSEVAARTGRSDWGVYQKRYALGIPNPRDGRKRVGS